MALFTFALSTTALSNLFFRSLNTHKKKKKKMFSLLYFFVFRISFFRQDDPLSIVIVAVVVIVDYFCFFFVCVNFVLFEESKDNDLFVVFTQFYHLNN